MFSQSRHDHGWGERVWARHPGGYQPEDWYIPPLNLHQWDVPVLLRPHRSCQCSHHPHVHRCPRVPVRSQRPAPKKVCSWNADPAWACPKWCPAGLRPKHTARVQPPAVLHPFLHQFWRWDGWVEDLGVFPGQPFGLSGKMSPGSGQNRHSSAPHWCHSHSPHPRQLDSQPPGCGSRLF